jgi:hypothetical protein
VEYSIQKTVTVNVEMSLDEVRILRELLFQWQREVGQKLPEGPTAEQSDCISVFTNIYAEGIR